MSEFTENAMDERERQSRLDRLADLSNRLADLRQRSLALQQHYDERASLRRTAAALLKERGVNTIEELPPADQQALAARAAQLAYDMDLELERRLLDRMTLELWSELPINSSRVQ